MEEQTQTAPTLCRTGCGFFGSSATEGMCSQCFRDYQRRKQEQSTAKNQNTNQQINSPNPSPSTAVASSLEKGVEEIDFGEACVHNMMNGGVQATPLSDLPASSQTTPAKEDHSSLTAQKSPKKNRCFLCRKKVGLTGFHCRCGEQFCALHRYADKHNCSFDYKTSGREELERKHPKVVATKVQKL